MNQRWSLMQGIALGLLLFVGGLQSACDKAPDSSKSIQQLDDRSAAVRVVEAKRTTVRRSFSVGGVAEAWHEARLTPLMSGSVDQILVQLGQDVKQGQVLARMDTSMVQLQAKQAQKALELARLQMVNATNETERAERLAQGGAVSPQQLDQARLGRDLATAQYEQAKAAVDLVNSQISDGVLRAPFDGSVSAIAVDDGEFFSAMGGLTGPPSLVTVTALDPIRLDIHIPDTDLRFVQAGMKAAIKTDALPDMNIEGIVEFINSVAAPGTRSFLVRLRVENPDKRIKPGMFLRAYLILEETQNVVAIPKEAIIDQNGAAHAVIIADKTAHRRSVSIGLHGDEGVVVEGIQEGEQVVIEGHFGLPDGSSVRVVQ